MKKITTLVACTMIVLYGCSPYYYAPNKGNVPNMRDKNDIRLDAGLGGGLVMNGADIQFAYAPLSHFGMMVNGALTTSKYSVSNYDIDHSETKSHYLEAGLGYFTKLKENTNWVFEVYGGAGKGEYKSWYSVDEYALLGMKKYFIQPSLSFTHPRRHIEFSVGSRFSGVTHSIKNTTLLNNGGYNELRNLRNFTQGPSSVYWEPTFRFSGGSTKVKGYVSYTPSFGMFNTYDDFREFFNISLGIRLTMNASRKK